MTVTPKKVLILFIKTETIAEAKAVLARHGVPVTDFKYPFESEQKFKRWQRAHFFNAKYDMSDIEDDTVKAFLGKILLFPTGNGGYRTKYQGEHYNFDDSGIMKIYNES